VERVEHKRRYLPELALLAAFMSLGGKGLCGRCWWPGLVNRMVVKCKGGIVTRIDSVKILHRDNMRSALIMLYRSTYSAKEMLVLP
jgi:hypothetical protein